MKIDQREINKLEHFVSTMKYQLKEINGLDDLNNLLKSAKITESLISNLIKKIKETV